LAQLGARLLGQVVEVLAEPGRPRAGALREDQGLLDHAARQGARPPAERRPDRLRGQRRPDSQSKGSKTAHDSPTSPVNLPSERTTKSLANSVAKRQPSAIVLADENEWKLFATTRIRISNRLQ
jgi:hypothetical protein